MWSMSSCSNEGMFAKAICQSFLQKKLNAQHNEEICDPRMPPSGFSLILSLQIIWLRVTTSSCPNKAFRALGP